MAIDLCLDRCPDGCLIFDRVVVSHATIGGSVVSWALTPSFTEPGPLTFQLQVGETGSNDADDWEDVGAPVVDQFAAVDGEQRIWGMTRYSHYRVSVRGPSNVLYYSLPTRLEGTLSRDEWRVYQSLLYAKLTEFRAGYEAQEGLILKRRISGKRCRRCTNPMTDDVKDGQCEVCYGTGFECGFYYPVGCAWARGMTPKSDRTERDGGSARGAINDVKITAEMLVSITFMESMDVWVNLRTDERWYVQRVTNDEEVRGVPVTAAVELRLAPATDILYSIPLPQQEDYRGLLLA